MVEYVEEGKREGRGKEKFAGGGVWRSDQAGQPKKGQGTMSLAGCRDSVPAGVWGNAPTAPRATNSKEAANKGAGSEASLPVTLRVLRRAPKLLYPTSMQCRARWARPRSLTSDHSWSFPQAGVSPLRRRPKGSENRRSLRSPFGNLRFDTPILLGLSYIGYNQKTWHRSAENSISKQDESTRKGERFALLFCCVLLYKWRFWAIKTRINQHCFVEIVQRCKMTKKHSFFLAKIMI